MSRYVLSDPHGEYGLFCKLLEKIKFSDRDEMIVCGDMLDKGSEPVRLAKFVFSMPNIRCIMGNHEYQFLKFYWSLMQNSPEDFDEVLAKLQAYHQRDGHLLDWETVDKLESLPPYLEERGFICVHAGIPLTAQRRFPPLSAVSVEQLIYDRNFKEPSVLPQGEPCVFFGHTPTNYVGNRSDIITYPKVDAPKKVSDYCKIHLDTGACMTGIMGCFCMDTLQSVYVGK